MSIPSEANDLQAARERARLAMGGEATLELEKQLNSDLEEKRKAARLAMEGTDRKLRRESKEKEEKEKEEMRRRIDEEVKRRAEEATKLKEKELADREAAEKARLAELKNKENAFTESRNVIEELKQEKGSSLHPLRTMKTDLASAVQRENISATKIAIAEQQRPAVPPQVIKEEAAGSTSKIFALSFIFLLILAGSAGGYWYWQNRTDGTSTPRTVVQSVIYAEDSREVSTESVPASGLVSAVNVLLTEPSTGETLTNLYFTKRLPAVEGASTGTKILDFDEFLQYSESVIPEDFARFVTSYMIGVYKGNDKDSVFLTFKVDLYENMFQEILENEQGYIRSIFKNLDGQDIPIQTEGQKFADRLYKNLDTRVLTDSTGKVLIIYTFLDRQTLLFARNEDALYRAYISYNTPRPK